MTYLDAMSRATRFTAKYRNYTSLYDTVLASLPPDPTVLEIGIANGGSLQTWRTLLGPGARIIGIDLNENARALEKEGFEIHILDSADEKTWAHLRERLAGAVDLLVDDGGHTNQQQISTLLHGVPLVRDGGWLVIEDLHASFMAEFGNPSPYSTARFLNELAADLHRLHPRSEAAAKHPNLAASVEYMITGTSWAGMRIKRRQASWSEEVTGGHDTSLMDYDHRWDSSLGRRLPARLKPLFENRYSRLLTALLSRRLFARDSDRR
jgi:hypothetical protein